MAIYRVVFRVHCLYVSTMKVSLREVCLQGEYDMARRVQNGRVGNKRVEFTGVFAPAEGMVRPPEQPYRQELCLNGRWQFQPVPVPTGYRRGEGAPPELPQPRPDSWERVPIKIPSPWNVNAWGTGHITGDPAHPYDPGSTYFPSYPAAWKDVSMGWLRRTFRVPSGWQGRRLILHFEAVAGACQIWINGKRAGDHFDSWLPFDLDITDLVRLDGTNEILVGVQAHALFDKQSKRYAKMHAPYPNGSETERLVGIWQDVFLLGLPPVRVQNIFVKPLVDQDIVALEVTIINDTNRPQPVRVSGEIRTWIPSVSKDVLSAPVPTGKVGTAALALPDGRVLVPPHGSAKITLQQRVNGRLNYWTPDTPILYAALLTLKQNDRPLDCRCERFGWRQFKILGKDLLLNGRKITLFGDLLHPFGPFVLSRRYTWAWYQMIKDFGGNCARPHAQIHPRHYLDLADEIGLVILDETALFGSSIQLNFEEPIAWQRFTEHYEGLILRDRNHPSVLGWSFGNELFAIFALNQVSPEDADRWYAQLLQLGKRARSLDPTREWISCDGDEDLRGTLPVWSKHFGHGLPLDRLPANLNKPLMVGESGGSYYARPAQLAVFNGDRAYASYQGRNEALAIDLYENITRMARPRLTYFSASEIGWFGLEHLGFGYRDRKRLPTEQDGVFFTRPFEEGRPGMQLERLPPYVCTLNPGWDMALPLYKPLPMFQAAKAALAQPQPRPLPWSRFPGKAISTPLPVLVPVEQVTLLGEARDELGRRLSALGVSFMQESATPSSTTGGFTIVDADTLNSSNIPAVKTAMERLRANGGTILWMLGAGKARPEMLDTILPTPLRLTERSATAFIANETHPWLVGFTITDLYFAEDGANRFLQRFGLGGKLVEQGKVVLRASETDWSLFNNSPERAKCAAVVLYEQLEKPSGVALLEVPYGKGKIALCSLDYRVRSRAADSLWSKLLKNMGLKLNASQQVGEPAFEGPTLVYALGIGRFGAESMAEALTRDFIGEATVTPQPGMKIGDLTWEPVISPSRDRFVLRDLKQIGPQTASTTYFSFWIRSPRALDDLLGGGPDAPRFGMLCYIAERGRLFLNGKVVAPVQQSPADYRILYRFEDLPLRKGWNRFLIKVVSEHYDGDQPATLAVRMTSSNEAYLRELDTTVALDPASVPISTP